MGKNTSMFSKALLVSALLATAFTAVSAHTPFQEVAQHTTTRRCLAHRSRGGDSPDVGEQAVDGMKKGYKNAKKGLENAASDIDKTQNEKGYLFKLFGWKVKSGQLILILLAIIAVIVLLVVCCCCCGCCSCGR